VTMHLTNAPVGPGCS